MADQFEKRARQIGLEILGHDSIDAKAQEFSALMTTIRQKNPDLIYFGGTTQTKAGQLVKDMISAGMDKVKMMAPDGCYEKAMIDKTGAKFLVDRFYCTFGGLTPDRLLIGEVYAPVERLVAYYGHELSGAHLPCGSRTRRWTTSFRSSSRWAPAWIGRSRRTRSSMATSSASPSGRCSSTRDVT